MNESNTNTALVPTCQDIEVTATQPGEMVAAQGSLIEWCNRKIAQLKGEHQELQSSYEHAVAHKWKSGVFKRHADMALKRVTYYEKIRGALEAGYCIVPNFPITLFAIRTGRKKPDSKWHFGTYSTGSFHFQQTAEKLPAGEGDYKSPNPLVETLTDTAKKPDGSTVKNFTEHATDFDAVDFPIAMAKPKIMEATSRAMALKVFDQFGLFDRGTDPIITGEIIDPRNQYRRPEHMRRVTFIIAWHINTHEL